MRADCKHYETRTYASGDTVRKCNLDLAPDAPWRCPEGCKGFERRLADVNWARASLIAPPTPPEPPGLDDGSAAALLDEAENIVNAAGPSILRELDNNDRGARRRAGSNGGSEDGPDDDTWWRRTFGKRR